MNDDSVNARLTEHVAPKAQPGHPARLDIALILPPSGPSTSDVAFNVRATR